MRFLGGAARHNDPAPFPCGRPVLRLDRAPASLSLQATTAPCQASSILTPPLHTRFQSNTQNSRPIPPALQQAGEALMHLGVPICGSDEDRKCSRACCGVFTGQGLSQCVDSCFLGPCTARQAVGKQGGTPDDPGRGGGVCRHPPHHKEGMLPRKSWDQPTFHPCLLPPSGASPPGTGPSLTPAFLVAPHVRAEHAWPAEHNVPFHSLSPYRPTSGAVHSCTRSARTPMSLAPRWPLRPRPGRASSPQLRRVRAHAGW